VEDLARAITEARPYYVDSKAKLAGRSSRSNKFPNEPGVYIILRHVNLPVDDYRMKGVNTKSPLVLYVGKGTERYDEKKTDVSFWR